MQGGDPAFFSPNSFQVAVAKNYFKVVKNLNFYES
jgi:hypothetical protein